MAGTPGNEKALKYLEDTFRRKGFEPTIEEFPLPPKSKTSQIFLPIFLIAWGILSYYNAIFISGILGYLFAGFFLLVPILLIIILFKLEVLFKRMIKKNFEKIKTIAGENDEKRYKNPVKKGRNIFVEVIPETGKYESHLYLTAHHDSTTLKFNMRSLRLLSMVGLLAGIIYILSYFIHYIGLLIANYDLFEIYSTFYLIDLIIFLVFINFLLFGRIFRSNRSHGANDDLTGTALVLELASIAKEIKPNLKITFILFDAEEVGLLGSSYHYFTREAFFKSEKLHVVSIDMIGEIPPLSFVKQIKPIMAIPMNSEFNDQMQTLAQRLGIEMKLRKFFYPGSDFACWLLNGYPANWVISPSKYIHSAQDVAQNVNGELVNECLKLFTAYFLQYQQKNT